MALCSVLSCYLVYSLPIAFIPQTSLGLLFLARDPAVLLLFVIPSLCFFLVRHHIKPLCSAFLSQSPVFLSVPLGIWPFMVAPLPEGPLVQQVCANFRSSVSLALHLSLTICDDPLSELFSVLSSSFLELSSALRVTAVEANSRPQAHPLPSCISMSSLSSPAFGLYPWEMSLLCFPPPYAHTSQKIKPED